MSPSSSPNDAQLRCARPISLLRTDISVGTGEVLAQQVVERRCGTRLASVCPSCSALYAGDARALIRSGLTDPMTGERVELTFVTLTAPGADVFGPVHSQRRAGGKRGKARRCPCRRTHRDGDPLLGTPVRPRTYRYDLAADYNSAAGRLAAVTWQKLARIIGHDGPLRVARVMEFQARGLVHVHALVAARISQADLDLVVSGGLNPRTGRRIQAARHGRWSWGPRCRADRVSGRDEGRVGHYMTKVVAYAVKAAGEERPNSAHAARMTEAGAGSCRCGLASPDCRYGSRVGVATHDDGTVSSFAWQTPTAQRPCRRHVLARRGWGFRGHVFAASRRWGTTFSALRAKRAAWRGGSAADAAHVVTVWVPAGRAPGAARRLDSVQHIVTVPPRARLEDTARHVPGADAMCATLGTCASTGP